MKLQSTTQINHTVIAKGTNVAIKKYNPMMQGSKFLFIVTEGEHKGFEFWSTLQNIKKHRPTDPTDWINVCLIDYIKAGWDYNRIVKAGLVPNHVKPFLPQFLKYKNKLITI